MWKLIRTVSAVTAFLLLHSVQAFNNGTDSTGLVCPPMEFGCKNAYRCIERGAMCNGKNDCGDNSDEDLTNCILHEAVSAQLNCTSEEFLCANGFRCVPKRFLCDNDNDCKDNSDEDPMECIRAGIYDDNVTCADIGFTCGGVTGRCISRKLLCNGKNDCGDNSDEDLTNCRAEGIVPHELTCRDVEFQCKNNFKCLPKQFMCDNDNDCLDGSDEDPVECAKEGVVPEGTTCADLGFECTNTTFGGSFCIGNLYICDGKDHCGDNSDENPEICEHRADKPMLEMLPWYEPPEPNSTVVRRCGNDQFLCLGNCVSKKHLCDSKIICPGRRDEQIAVCRNRTAGAHKCMSHEFKCKNNNGTKCIHKRYVCDGDNDCGDMSDEDPITCNSTVRPTTTTTASSIITRTRKRPLICKRDQFKCSDGNQCIRKAFVCDRDRECEDGSDETPEACSSVGIEPSNATADTSCDLGYFQCNNKRCIRRSFVCDGDNDCGDYTDESLPHCNRSSSTRSGGSAFTIPPAILSCMGGKFLCQIFTPTPTCIPRLQVCDGISNCPDGEDEHPELCHRSSVSTLESTSTTVHSTTVGSCAANEFMCADDNKCIRGANVCDGLHDCGDGSDEDPAVCLRSASSQRPLEGELEVTTDSPTYSGHHYVHVTITVALSCFFLAIVVTFLVKKYRSNRVRHRLF